MYKIWRHFFKVPKNETAFFIFVICGKSLITINCLLIMIFSGYRVCTENRFKCQFWQRFLENSLPLYETWKLCSISWHLNGTCKFYTYTNIPVNFRHLISENDFINVL